MDLVRLYGRRFYAGAAVHCFFGSKEAARYFPILGDAVGRLEDVVVVREHGGLILTTYRNRNALKHLKRKPKWGRRAITAP